MPTDQPPAGGADPRAPVIDLEAETVRAADATPPRPEPAPRTSGRSWLGWLATVAIVLAAMAGAWLYRQQSARDAAAMVALETRIVAIESSGGGVAGRLDSLDAATESLKAEQDRVAGSAASAAAAADEAARSAATSADGVGALAQRLDKTEAALSAARADIEALRSSVVAGTGAPVAPAVDAARLDGLQARVDELEKTVAALKTVGEGQGDGQAAVLLSQALADLKAKFAAGAPFASELDRIAQLVPAAPGLEILEGHKVTGLASATGLAEELGRIAATLPEPAADNAASGTWDWLVDALGSVVTVRRIGETDWRAVAARAQGEAQTGDLAGAIGTITAIEGEAPAILIQWTNTAKARLRAEAAVEEISAAVLRQIAALGLTR